MKINNSTDQPLQKPDIDDNNLSVVDECDDDKPNHSPIIPPNMVSNPKQKYINENKLDFNENKERAL